MPTEKTTEKTALPETGYYTDAEGYTWQLSAEQASKLGYTAADPEPTAASAVKPAGPAAPTS